MSREDRGRIASKRMEKGKTGSKSQRNGEEGDYARDPERINHALLFGE